MSRAGLGRARVRVPDGTALAGYGPFGGRGVAAPAGSALEDHLQARALLLEDPRGHRLLWVVLDVLCGSRVIQAALIEALARAGHPWASEANVWVTGTHTHSGPGHFTGTLYDTFGHYPFGYRDDVVAELVRAALEAARAAFDALAEARLGVARVDLWGAGRNRSLPAFLADLDGDLSRWRDPGALGQGADPKAPPEEQAIDPRLTVLTVVSAEGRVRGTLAVWCCHPATFLPESWRPFHRDWCGVAQDHVERALSESGEPGATAMVVLGAAGDVTSVPAGYPPGARDLGRVREIGERVAAAWTQAVRAARERAQPIDLELGFARWRPSSDPVLPRWEIGSPVMVGSDEVRTAGWQRAFGEARRWPWRSSSQRPKLPALGPAQRLVAWAFRASPSPEHPLHACRLGAWVFFASPFELTTHAARALEEVLASRVAGAGHAVPVALTNDYAGYVTTPAAYELQHYEGAHTLYGSRTLERLASAWEGVAGPGGLVVSGDPRADEAQMARRVADVMARLGAVS